MSNTDIPNHGLFDDVMFPFIDNDFDWDAFFNFDPETDEALFILQDATLTRWEALGSAHQDQL
jgi:hypothetical protein